MEAFPNAKVVLTVRRPETWYTSVSSTIHKGVKMQKTDFAVWLFSRLQRGGEKPHKSRDDGGVQSSEPSDGGAAPGPG